MSRAKYLISAQKLEELQAELNKLVTEGRKDIAERFKSLQTQTVEELDDPFAEVSDDKFYLERRVEEIEDILKNYELIHDDPNFPGVEIGSFVRVGFEGFEDNYEIVDPVEADPLQKKISCESPVGKALLGKFVGETVEVNIGGISKKFRVLEIKSQPNDN